MMKRLLYYCYFSQLLLLPAKINAQQKADSIFNNTFFLGTHLMRMPKPPDEELIKDIRLLKSKGFNLIKIQTHWAIDEPAEGKFDFTQYEAVLNECDKLGLRVYIGLTLEQAPAWLYNKFPDCRMMGRDGLPVKYESHWTLPYDGKPGPCFFHPGAQAAQMKYLSKIVKTLGRHKSVAVWNTWQEIALWAEASAGFKVDYNPYTLAHFAKWLQKKFITLDALNKSWGTRFTTWNEVAPVRMPGVLGSGLDVQWNIFMENEYISYRLRTRYEAIKKADEKKRPVFAHRGSPTIGSGQDWTLAASQDFMGSSGYPGWSAFHEWDDGAFWRKPAEKHTALLTEMWSNLALNFDYIRSSNKKGNPVWAAEFQAGPVSTYFHKGRVPSSDDVRRWMLTLTSTGVNTISFWVTRAEIIAAEHNGFSLLDSEGDSTARFNEAAKVAAALMQYPDLFGKPSQQQADVGIIVDEDNYQFCAAFTGMHKHLAYSMRGWYKYLWDLNIPVDFIPITQINSSTSSHYKTLVLPFPISLSDTSAARLLNYVQNGGNLISECGIGRITENGFNPRGEMNPLIRAALGIKQKSFQMMEEPNGEQRWMPSQRTWGEFLPSAYLQGINEFATYTTLANFYVQTFEPGNASIILQYNNEAAGIEKNIGKGKFYLLGTFVGHNATAHTNDSTKKFIAGLMQACGTQRQNAGQLLVRKRMGNNREAWIITNTLPNAVTETISVNGFSKAADLFTGALPFTDNKIIITLQPLDATVLVLTK
jgi:beta-galactosidase